jgi:hypothetical protein
MKQYTLTKEQQKDFDTALKIMANTLEDLKETLKKYHFMYILGWAFAMIRNDCYNQYPKVKTIKFDIIYYEVYQIVDHYYEELNGEKWCLSDVYNIEDKD